MPDCKQMRRVSWAKARFSRGRAALGRVVVVLFTAVLMLASKTTLAGHRQIVRVGVYDNPPKLFFSGGHISGILGNLVYAIALRENWQIVPIQCTWAQCLSMVEKGRIDLMPDVAFTERRSQLMSFGSVPALFSWSKIYSNPKERLHTIEDLSNTKIAVLDGSTQERYLRQLLENFRVKGAHLLPTKSMASAFMLAKTGRADAVVANKFFGDAEAAKYGLDGTPISFQPTQLYFVTAKGRSASLRAGIDEYLSRWEADPVSVYYKILSKWRVRGEPFHIPVWTWWTIGALALVLLVTLVVTLVMQLRGLGKIRRLAYYDPLTGLANRTFFLERIEHALSIYERSGINGALLFIDLDNFKGLNDTLGHAKGDLLLKQAAQRLLRHVRKGDILARLGGDEFLLLMPNLHDARAPLVTHVLTEANSLRDVLTEEPYDLGGSTYRATASIGVALFSDATMTIEDGTVSGILLKQADMAMYAAKNAGRNQVQYFTPIMQAAVAERHELERLMIDALQTGQFHLVYQAIVDRDQNVVGAEALARWEHPERGSISPDVFIPLAESTGLILPLGEWILREACRELAAWRNDAGYAKLCLAVNVSAWQFSSPQFVPLVKEIVENSGADARRLKLELTESVMVENTDELIGKMNALRDIGIQFSLDDFGTGYSSLSFLKRLPLDSLKIDRSFVRDLLENESEAAIVRAIVSLGDTLSIAIIAEGVETQMHYEYLRDLGCTLMQGYLFGRPGEARELFRLGYTANGVSQTECGAGILSCTPR